jgi:pimeloyl-ACP methyl ester carboxylesterase
MVEAPPGSGPTRSDQLDSDWGNRHLDSRTPRQNGRNRSPRTERSLDSAVALVQGAALIPIVAWDGTALWRVARVVAVSAVTASVIWFQRRRGSRLASFSVWAWGAVGVAVGIGIGVVHLLKAGMSVYAALALVCLLAGLTATARSLYSFVNPREDWHREGWRRLIAVPAAAVALILVYYPLTVSLIATNTPRVDLGAAVPSDWGLVFEDVTFPTPDGVDLSGWFMPGSNGAAVVILHGGGGGSNRTSVLSQARVLVDHGYSVLAFDARGHGRSGGDGMDWGWYGDLDIAGALDFLESLPEVDPGRLAAVGLSMGGEQAMTAAASDTRIKAVVAEGATNRVLADDDAFLPSHPGRWVNIAADWIKYGITDWITGARPPMALTSTVIAIAPRPVLLITAGTVADEGRAAANFQAAAPTSVEVWNVDGASHTSGLATAPTEWETRVIGFLDQAIGN